MGSYFAYAVLRLEVRLDFPALGFLLDAEGSEVWRDVLIDFKAKALSCPKRSTSSQESIEHFEPSSSTIDDSGNASVIRTRLPLVFDDGRIYILLVPLAWKQFFAVFVDRRCHDPLRDV